MAFTGDVENDEHENESDDSLDEDEVVDNALMAQGEYQPMDDLVSNQMSKKAIYCLQTGNVDGAATCISLAMKHEAISKLRDITIELLIDLAKNYNTIMNPNKKMAKTINSLVFLSHILDQHAQEAYGQRMELVTVSENIAKYSNKNQCNERENNPNENILPTIQILITQMTPTATDIQARLTNLASSCAVRFNRKKFNKDLYLADFNCFMEESDSDSAIDAKMALLSNDLGIESGLSDRVLDIIYVVSFDSKPFGMTWTGTKGDANVWVSSVDPKGAACAKGVVAGSMVVALNGTDIRDIGAKKIIEKASKSRLPIRVTFRKPEGLGDPKSEEQFTLNVDIIKKCVDALSDPSNRDLSKDQKYAVCKKIGATEAEIQCSKFLSIKYIDRICRERMIQACVVSRSKQREKKGQRRQRQRQRQRQRRKKQKQQLGQLQNQTKNINTASKSNTIKINDLTWIDFELGENGECVQVKSYDQRLTKKVTKGAKVIAVDDMDTRTCGAQAVLAILTTAHGASITFESPASEGNGSNNVSNKFTSSNNGITSKTNDNSNGMDNKRSDKQHQCPQCKKWFYTKLALQVHVRAHGGPKVKQRYEIMGNYVIFRCFYCEANFESKLYLKRHQKKCSQKKYECGKCLKRFKQKSNLKEHKKNHKRD